MNATTSTPLEEKQKPTNKKVTELNSNELDCLFVKGRSHDVNF